MKTIVVAMVLAVLFATAAAQAGTVNGSSSTGSIPVELHFDSADLSFDKYDGYDLISVPGCRFTREIGKPALPAKSVFVAMPANSELTGIEVVSSRTETLSGEYTILPAQPPIPTMTGAAAGFVSPSSVYDSSDMYPGAVCGGAGVGSLRGYMILSFRVFPLQYSPVERRLILYEEIILDVKYETPRYAAADAGGVGYVGYVGAVGMTGREDDEFYRIAAGLVANPGDISRAVPTTRTIPEDRIMPLSKSIPPEKNAEYVIITSDSLEDEFQRLADWKTKKGVPATVVNTSWIEGSYAGTGVDTQERIRNFINDAYTAGGTKWVLLGGDTDIIPCRGGYGWVNGSAAIAEGSYEDKSIPADLYYSDLDGDWDANGNLTYGEVNDSVDLYPDVFVGRAPVDSVAEARTFVDKTLRYEKNPPPNYTRDILFLAEYLDAETDGGDTKDMIEADCMLENFSLVKLYERYGNLSKGSAMGELNRGCNIVNHIGHGRYTGFCVGSGWIGRSDVSSLTNSPRNFILYTISCYSNNFETDSVSEHYMNNEDGGSVGYIGNSRYGWYDPEVPPGEGPSDLYDREFFNITFNESAYRLGEVVGYSKVRYIPLSQEDETAMRWLQYAINLLGDPELPIRTETPRNFLISMPSQIPARKQTLVISVSEIGHDNRSVQVRNATVCILKRGEVYNVSKTDASGVARFMIDPDAGALDVTVTKENYRVYEGVIDIYSVPDIYVNTTGWWRDDGMFNANGTPIQSAVDGADAGETIFVRNGSYTENVDVGKTLTLRGEGADVVTVTAASSTDHVFEVGADRVNLSGFTVRGAADGYMTAGICLVYADHCDLSDNIISNNNRGINMTGSSNNTIFHNDIINNSVYDSNPANNDWHHPVLLEGNYWSDYIGIDDGSGTGKHSISGDGVGDTLIPHPDAGYDNYPCMKRCNPHLKGDLNHDGTLTSADVLIALEIAVSGGYLLEADIDESGYVNALDARRIMQAAAGAIKL
jgi:parallel beta-helix repeat protein